GVSNSPSGTTTDETSPADITDLGIKAVTQNSITINWTAPGDNGNVGTATQYDIRNYSAPITELNWALATPLVAPVPSPAGTEEVFVVSGLNPDTTYYFAMKTADEVPNWAGVSNSPSGKTLDLVAPADITDLVTSDFEQNSIRLNWTAPGDNGNVGIADQYDIRYSTALITEANWALAAQALGEPVPSSPGTGESFVVNGLNVDITYYFAIKTADEVPNWAGVSNSPSGTTTDETPPADITDLATGNPTMTSITLTWTAPGDNGNSGTATTYDIRNYTVSITEANWALATQLTGEPIPSVAGSGETFIVTGLSQSTTYYFAIKTADEVPNWAGVSNSPSGTTISTPSQPTNLRAMGTDTQIILKWNAPASNGGGPITGYNIYRGPVPDGEVFLISIGNVLLYADLGLANGNTYYYKVAAVNTAGEGPLSNEASATPDPNWITGLCGLYVYGTDSGTLMWKTSDTACVGPQCIGGSLVTDNGEDFSEYPARNDCKSKGGWLPTITELECMYDNNDMLGLPSGNNYWSSEEQNNPFARSVQFSDRSTQAYKKTNPVPHTYCVK
ncbi:MAG: fibronectin type III domain-containing protein, partial [Candidatus Aenigmarchaeota archaeon]|nr:fibronectin type III domain-containing protein [Candidatus Aenigmarchaeota archaeon]